MAATTIFTRLLLPAVKSKKTLGHTVLLTKNWNCVTSQFYPISCGDSAFAKKNPNISTVKPEKEKKSGKKGFGIRAFESRLRWQSHFIQKFVYLVKVALIIIQS